jgi:hypothetical protein
MWVNRVQVGLLAALLVGCIERPGDDLPAPVTLDRARLSDVLVSSVPPIRFTSGAVFDEAIELAGVDVTPDPLQPGGRATVTLWWRALADLREDWKIFVHVSEGPSGPPKVNADHWPAADRARTNGWRRGDVVRDTFSFTVPADAEGRLELWTGFYAGDERMPVTQAGRGGSDGANRIRAATLALR